jgi:hypothetical protein
MEKKEESYTKAGGWSGPVEGGSKTVLMLGASKEALDADTRQSDNEYIAAKQKKKTMDFVVVNQSSGPHFSIHRKGCGDINRRQAEANTTFEAEGSSGEDLAKKLRAEFADEDGLSPEEWGNLSEFHIAPCARGGEPSEKKQKTPSPPQPDVEKALTKTKPKKKNSSKNRGKKKAKSKTSGWSKLKEELPSSGAVKARLADGSHSDGYRKVLESLEKYWTKRGK